jgi:hypothetical protein
MRGAARAGIPAGGAGTSSAMTDSDEVFRQDERNPGRSDDRTTEPPADSASTSGFGGTRRGSLDAEIARGDDAPIDLDPEDEGADDIRSDSGT